eukprot:TRINITY_DN16318_c0_g1_i1.p1 TRINITY_DN16318_c0_g1~~TRINITY_DN16318_c0_g1_i1.p1  ORF type:complete len:584 (+),score=116.80 TRINITY_DN16318_c0_g1_i1:230-1753(+)
MKPIEECIVDLGVPFVLMALSGNSFLVRAMLLVVDFSINLHSVAYVANRHKIGSKGNLLADPGSVRSVSRKATEGSRHSQSKNRTPTPLGAVRVGEATPASRYESDPDSSSLEEECEMGQGVADEKEQVRQLVPRSASDVSPRTLEQRFNFASPKMLNEHEDDDEYNNGTSPNPSDLSPIVDDTQLTSFVLFSKWEIPKSFFLTRKFVVSFMFVTFLIMVLPVVILVAANSDVVDAARNSEECFNIELQVCIVEFVILALVSAIAFFISRRLKVVQEHLGIKSELKKSSYAIFFILALSLPNIATARYPEMFLLTHTGIQFYQIIELVLPVSWIIYQSLYRIAYRATFGVLDQVKVSSDIAVEFLSLLNSPSGFLLFQEYMIQQLRVEDLLFWKDVERFRNKEVDGITIFEIYVDSKAAPLQVEMNPFTRAGITWFFKNGDTDYEEEQVVVERRLRSAKKDLTALHADNVFDEAYIEVFRRMLSKNFRIFRHSEEYKSWVWLRTRNT